MSGDAPERLNEALQRQRALSRWENEGGAVPSSSPAAIHAAEEPPPFPKMDDAEFQALHVRVIALENLMIALLVSDRTKTERWLERWPHTSPPGPASHVIR